MKNYITEQTLHKKRKEKKKEKGRRKEKRTTAALRERENLEESPFF